MSHLVVTSVAIVTTKFLLDMCNFTVCRTVGMEDFLLVLGILHMCVDMCTCLQAWTGGMCMNTTRVSEERCYHLYREWTEKIEYTVPINNCITYMVEEIEEQWGLKHM